MATMIHPNQLSINDFDNFTVDDIQLKEYLKLLNNSHEYSGY